MIDIASWLMRKGLIFGQRSQKLAVDPELLAGHTPRWAISLFWFLVLLAALPFGVWIVAHIMPEQVVIDVGQFMDRILWSHIKSTDVARCAAACRDLAFGMVALPITWLTGLIGAFFWREHLVKAAVYQTQWLRMQPGMTEAKRRSIGVFRDRSGLILLVFISTIILQAAALLLPGEIKPAARGAGAYTGLSFAAFCAFLNLATAATVAHLFPIRHIPLQEQA